MSFHFLSSVLFVACVLSACGDPTSQDNPTPPETSETDTSPDNNEAWRPNTGTSNTPEPDPDPNPTPNTPNILDGEHFFQNLEPWEDWEDPSGDFPYCTPETFVAPPPNTEPLPDGCDPNTDPNVPCLVDLFSYTEPIACAPTPQRPCGWEEQNSFIPTPSTWACNDAMDPRTHDYADPDIRETISNEEFIPTELLDAPSARYTDHTDARGLLKTRIWIDEQRTDQHVIHYTYHDDDTLAAWAYVVWNTNQAGEWVAWNLQNTGQFDRLGVLRFWESANPRTQRCRVRFNASGIMVREHCQIPPTDWIEESIRTYDCRGKILSWDSLEGMFDSYQDRTWWTYDDYGRLITYGQDNVQLHETYTVTYAQDPPEPVDVVECSQPTP